MLSLPSFFFVFENRGETGEAGQFLREGQRAQLHHVVPPAGHLRVPALRNGRPGAAQERKVLHPLPARGRPFRLFYRVLPSFTEFDRV